jgi:type VI secretion system protein ImpF
MAELTHSEKLQPSLLDRLIDEQPDKSYESPRERVFSLKKLREVVLRDLGWLLNTANLTSVEDLRTFPRVTESVINYGIQDTTGVVGTNLDLKNLERHLKHTISLFEPRILPQSLRVKVTAHGEQMNRNALTFEIQGDLWAQPAPERLYLRSELDLETGNVSINQTTA